MTNTFALLGASGHIARWHADAIQSIGGRIVAACDPVPTCGYLDKHFVDAAFFTDEQAFKKHVAASPPDYVSICTPSYQHGRQVRDYLPITQVICEKPLGLTLDEYHKLRDFAIVQSSHLWLLHQRRFIPALNDLYLAKPSGRVHLDFIAPRGDWYAKSWKSDDHYSGGILLNIGIHAFDLLTWIYGPLKK
ncbi:MAG: Gfo/Idh/MocA family protein, partial [Candidatus Thorarchaeota archaeon]